MSHVLICGVGMTRFGRHADRSVKELVSEAVLATLNDAGIERRQIGAAYYGSVAQGYFENQVTVPGQIALLSMGFSGLPVVNVENACATGSTALHLAQRHVASGEADFVLAVGVEKMLYPDKAKVFSLFETGWDVHRAQENYDRLLELGRGVEVPPGFSRDAPFSRFMEVYAAFCRYHMREFGLSQRQLAIVAAKNHEHSQCNPLAQYQRPFTVEEVLASGPVCYPLTTLMCAPMTDGAAAVIVCSERAAARHGLTQRSVRIRASILRSASLRAAAKLDEHVTRLAALEAYEKAAIGPQEVHVAEVHDASAMGEILQTENLGFCKRGEGGAFAESGASRLGGRLPINPSGGLECKGHPIGATGLAQVFELVTQLRGAAQTRQVPNARIAVQENGGGLFGVEEAAAHIAVLSAD